MRNANNGKTYLDDFVYIDKADNFTNAHFVSLGKMNGLGNVAKIPVAGWAETVSAIPGCGYVIYRASTNTYYRLFVTEYTVNTLNEVIGSEVKYQRPFKGVDEELKPDNTSVSFSQTNEYGDFTETKTVTMLNQTIVPYEVASSASWCSATPFLNELRIHAGRATSTETEEATLTLTTLYGKKKEIKVTRFMSPYAKPDKESVNIDSYGTGGDYGFLTGVRCNVNYSELTLSSNVNWLEVAIDSPYDKSFSIIYKSKANYGSQRSGRIDINTKAGKTIASINVTQEAGDPSHVFSQQKVGFDKNGGAVTITCGIDANSEHATSSASWCTFTQNGNQLTIRASSTTSDRKATIKFAESGLSLEVVQAKYMVGDSYSENGVTGTVTYIGDDGKRFISKYAGKAQWSTENVKIGCIDEDDGRNNLAVVKKISNWEKIYPAFALCTAFGDGWYLPSYTEGGYIYYFNSGGRTLYLQDYYLWTSYEYDINTADVSGFGGGNKTSTYPVYAIHQF